MPLVGLLLQLEVVLLLLVLIPAAPPFCGYDGERGVGKLGHAITMHEHHHLHANALGYEARSR